MKVIRSNYIAYDFNQEKCAVLHQGNIVEVLNIPKNKSKTFRVNVSNYVPYILLLSEFVVIFEKIDDDLLLTLYNMDGDNIDSVKVSANKHWIPHKSPVDKNSFKYGHNLFEIVNSKIIYKDMLDCFSFTSGKGVLVTSEDESMYVVNEDNITENVGDKPDGCIDMFLSGLFHIFVIDDDDGKTLLYVKSYMNEYTVEDVQRYSVNSSGTCFSANGTVHGITSNKPGNIVGDSYYSKEIDYNTLELHKLLINPNIKGIQYLRQQL